MRTGLKERIEQANSEQEIADLLKRGADYKPGPSDKTRRRWNRAATVRRNQLFEKKHFKETTKV